MLRSIGIILGIVGTALWFMPLAKTYMAYVNYEMSSNGKDLSDIAPLTYGIPISMLLFSVSAYISQCLLQLVVSILGAICISVLYKNLGSGYTPAFFALSINSALCIALSIVNTVATLLRDA